MGSRFARSDGAARGGGISPRFPVLVAALSLLLILALIGATSIGAISIPLRSILSALTMPMHDWGSAEIILIQVRIPRVVTAALVGAGLSIAGVAMQTALRNPLAEPYLLGVSSGASFGAVSVIILGAGLTLPFAAFAGGLTALATTLLISRRSGPMQATRVILGGVAVTALFSALTSLVIFQSRDNDSYRQVLHWLLGSLSSVTWTSALIAACSLGVFGGLLVIISRLLDVLLLSDEEIHSLGIRAARARSGILVLAALVAAGMVSVSGAIGFVGLIVPHIARRIARFSQRELLIVSALAGALLLTLADLFSRIIVAPQELPVGITTSILGAIAFAIIMMHKQEVES